MSSRRTSQAETSFQPTQEDETNLREAERQRLALEQKRQIDQRITELQDELKRERESFNEFANSATPQQQQEFNNRSNALRELRDRTMVQIGELEGAKRLATGEYTTQSVLASASQRATAIQERGQTTLELREEIQDKLTKEGVSESRARQISQGGSISVQEAQRLSPETRKALGIEIRNQAPITGATEAERALNMSIADPTVRRLPPEQARAVIEGRAKVVSVPQSTRFGTGIDVVPVESKSVSTRTQSVPNISSGLDKVRSFVSEKFSDIKEFSTLGLSRADSIVQSRNANINDLNNRVSVYNLRYGGRELSPEEYSQAQLELSRLQAKQRQIEEQDRQLEQIGNEAKGKLDDVLDKEFFGIGGLTPNQIGEILRAPIGQPFERSVLVREGSLLNTSEIKFVKETKPISVGEILSLPIIGLEQTSIIGESIVTKTGGRGRAVGLGIELGGLTNPVVLGSVGTRGFTVVTNKELEASQRLGGAADVLFVAGVGVGAGVKKAIRYGREPLIFREPIKEPRIESITSAKTLVREGESIDVARFQLRTFKEPRSAVIIPRYKEALRNVFKVNTADESVSRVLAGGKRVVIDEGSAALSQSGNLIIKKGVIVNTGEVITITGKVGSTRTGKRVLSLIEGGMQGIDKELALVSVEKLPKAQQKALQKIGEVDLSIPVSTQNIPKVFKKTKIELGSVETTDIFKFKGRNLESIPLGRRKARADLIGVPREKIITTFPREFGLTERQLLEERLAVIESTFPTSRPPKNIPVIKGKITRDVINLPPRTEPINIQRPVKPSGKSLKQVQITKIEELAKVLNKPIASTALTQKSLTKTRAISSKQAVQKAGFDLEAARIRNLPKIVGGGGAKLSQFTGQGYDLQETQSFSLPVRESNRSLFKPLSNELSRSQSKSQAREIPRSISREVTRLLPREVAREVTREITQQATKQLSKQAPRLVQKQVPRPTQPVRPIPRTPTRNPPRTPRIKPPVLNFDITLLTGGKKQLGFKTFVVKGGKRTFLSGVRPKGLALAIGEKKALSSLRATFGITPTKKVVSRRDINFTPRNDIFRNYKIKQGKRIPLLNTFIQRRGKRLVTAEEVGAIQSARRRILI